MKLLLLLTAAFQCAAQNFESATVRVSATQDRPSRAIKNDATQFGAIHVAIRALIAKAWNQKEFAVSGEGIADVYYDVTAKVPAGTTKEDLQLMLQHLLSDRLGVEVHHENQTLTVYELTISDTGLKIREGEKAPAGDRTPFNAPQADSVKLVRDKDNNLQLPAGHPGVMIGGVDEQVRITARMQTIAQLAETLEGQLGHMVVDKTHLTDRYDYILTFIPNANAPKLRRTLFTPNDATELGPIDTAVENQLGLKLESKTAPVDVLVVDRFRKVPSGN